jgi:hypothetical protein
MLRVFWAATVLAIMSAGILDASPLGGGTSRHHDGVAQMLASGGPFP